ncbi:MAG: DUF4239 domain-containing protein [Candidatus Obscuribacterales bacterium]|nr:DUF4239 domain-containing protein [Candidatus Obscuribacterales bacterium]
MNSYVLGLVVVVVCTLLAVGGMLLVRRFIDLKTLNSYHEVAGYFLSIIGTLYAVLLGFVIVDAMNNLQNARMVAEQEANALCNVYLVSEGLSQGCRNRLRFACSKYADAVINDEWRTMRLGESSPKAVVALMGIWTTASRFKPSDPGEEGVHQTILAEVSNLSNNRRDRLVGSAHGVAPLMWSVLILGGVFTVVFTYFFGAASVTAQILMTVIVSITLSLNVFLVFVFGYPYATELGVRPEALRLNQMIFKRMEKYGGTAERLFDEWESKQKMPKLIDVPPGMAPQEPQD